MKKCDDGGAFSKGYGLKIKWEPRKNLKNDKRKGRGKNKKGEKKNGSLNDAERREVLKIVKTGTRKDNQLEQGGQ